MRVRNIECQLAQGQVRRYLNGDPLSDVAVEQLEDHLNECLDCNEFFQDCKQELIDDKAETEIEEEAYAPAQTSASSEISAVPRFLVDAIRQKRETLDRVVKPIATHAVITDVREEKPSLKSYTKPLLYSIGLAGVLIAMSTIMRDPSKVLGDRVETSLPPANTSSTLPTTVATSQGTNSTQPKSVQPEALKTSPETNSAAIDSAPNGTENSPSTNTAGSPTSASTSIPTKTNSTTVGTASANTPSPRRKATARRSTPTRPPTRRQRPVAKPIVKAPTSRPGIRVYDDGGNPISNR